MTHSDNPTTFSYPELDESAQEVARQAFGININRHIDFRKKTVATIVRVLKLKGLNTTSDAIENVQTPHFTFQYQTPFIETKGKGYLPISFDWIFSGLNDILSLAKERLHPDIKLSITSDSDSQSIQYAFIDDKTTHELYQCEIDAINKLLLSLYLDIHLMVKTTCPDCLLHDEITAIQHYRFNKDGSPHF